MFVVVLTVIGIYLNSVEGQTGFPIVGPGSWGGPICPCPTGLVPEVVQQELDPTFSVNIVPSSSLGYNGEDALKCPAFLPTTPTTCGGYFYPMAPPRGEAHVTGASEFFQVLHSGPSTDAFILRRIRLKVKYTSFVLVELWFGNDMLDSCSADIPGPYNVWTTFACEQGFDSGFCTSRVTNVTIKLRPTEDNFNQIARGLRLRTCVLP